MTIESEELFKKMWRDKGGNPCDPPCTEEDLINLIEGVDQAKERALGPPKTKKALTGGQCKA